MVYMMYSLLTRREGLACRVVNFSRSEVRFLAGASFDGSRLYGLQHDSVEVRRCTSTCVHTYVDRG